MGKHYEEALEVIVLDAADERMFKSKCFFSLFFYLLFHSVVCLP